MCVSSRFELLVWSGALILMMPVTAADSVADEPPRGGPAPCCLRYDFQRASPAYYGDGSTMHQYAENEPVHRDVAACSVSDGQYMYTSAGVVPHCRNSGFLFGRGYDQNIYRSEDGEHWECLGPYGTRCAWMSGLSDDTIIRPWYTEDDYLTVSHSSDDGLTWERAKWAGTGEDFIWLTHEAVLCPFGFHQAQSGTCIMVEYKLPAGGRYIYRSDDSGATWQVAHDAGQGVITHYHTVSKHEGLSRWVVSTGDFAPRQKLIASDDDGQTWYDYLNAGEQYMQPTYFLDYGHPTRLLFGSDTTWQVGWVDVSDGPDARKVASVLTNWNSLPSKGLCYCMFEHEGLYYACNYDHSDSAKGPVISVSADLEHWAVYHRFAEGELGALRFAGHVGGKLHICVRAPDYYKHLAISPARIATQESLVFSPPTENLFDSLATSSAASIAGWLNVSQELPPGSGYRGVLECVATTAHHGESCLHYVRSDGGWMVLLSPPVPFEVGRTYQGRFWAKGTGGRPRAQWRRNLSLEKDKHEFSIWPDDWREVVAPPLTVPGNTDELRLCLIMDSTTDNACELYVDSLQVEQVPSTPWHLGGTTRAPSCRQARACSPGQWTNVFTLEPDILSDHLSGAGELRLRSYWSEPDTVLELLYDPSDSRFKLRLKVDSVIYTPIMTSPQHFQQRAHIRLAVRCNVDGFSLAVANGQPIEFLPFVSCPGLAPSTLTIRCGPANGRNVLPGALFGDVIYSAYLSDEQLADAMDDLSGGIDLYGDVNCDGAVDAYDIDPFVLALTDLAGYAAAHPDCNINLADINGDGAVNAFDIDPFVALLIGG